MGAFDGAGKPYRGPSFRGALAILVVVVVGVALAWLLYSIALDVLNQPAAAGLTPFAQPAS